MKKNTTGKRYTVWLIVAWFTAFSLFFSAIGSAAESTIWNWSNENPKPVWWDFEEQKTNEKPVRGGVY